jgi:uncharacterized membrane protein
MEIIRNESSSYVNLHPLERWLSVLGGGALTAVAIRKRRFSLLVASAALLGRGYTGRSQVYRVLGVRTAGGGSPLPYELGVRARGAVTLMLPREQVFQFWRKLENLPRFMRHLISVQPSGDRRSHWVAEGPAGRRVEWDAEILNEVPNELIAWRSLERSDVDSAGSVRFSDAPGNRGTEVRVELQYNPPAGIVGAYVARVFGREPEQEIQADLLRLKQVLEAGEMAVTEGQPRGEAAGPRRRVQDVILEGATA